MIAARDATEQLAEFRRAICAEDYFRALDVPYEPQIVAVNRLHILRLLSTRIAELEPSDQDATPEVLVAAYRQGLVEAYEAFVGAGALDHRLFKVLQDHAPTVVVPLGAITIRRSRKDP